MQVHPYDQTKNNKKKKYFENRTTEINNFKDKILSNTHNFWLPLADIDYVNLPDHRSCFDILIHNSNNNFNTDINIKNDIAETEFIIFSKKIIMHLTNYQKIIIDRWMNSSIIMFNRTIKYLKSQIKVTELNNEKIDKKLIYDLKSTKRQKITLKNKLQKKRKALLIKKINKKQQQDLIKINSDIKQLKREIVEISPKIDFLHFKIQKREEKIRNAMRFETVRTNILKNSRDKIINNSQIKNIETNMKIKTHMLDYAIKQACSNYGTCVTNFRSGNQKTFNVKYQKNNKESKILDVEAQYIKQNQICPKILGNIKYTYDGKEYKLEDTHTVKMHYNKETDKYTLLVPEKKAIVKKEENEGFASCDPGIRTFQTIYTKKGLAKAGTNIQNKIKKELKRLDKVKENKDIPKKTKTKIEKCINKKIYNKIEEMHWKTIKYMTNRYKKIVIGNMSVKSITRKNNSVLSEMQKRIAYKLRFYNFNQKLKYKCQREGIEYKLVDEKYTSKICSNCGWENGNLEGDEIFDCKICKRKMDRDGQAARGIAIKAQE